jgi:tRNA-2-methylthio-N6-dimethylallyladenosine synthase
VLVPKISKIFETVAGKRVVECSIVSLTPVDQRTYVIHTFGCQMNEHDSERISGLLEADGLIRVENESDADVIVFNTCTIRENADEKLFGNLGHAKDLKARRPGVQIMVGGCQAQKDQGYIQERAPYVDVVFGTHNVHRAAELLRESRLTGPVMEILAESEQFPSALPVRREEDYSAWVTIQIGCDNSCAFCIVPSVRGVEISRPFDQLMHEVRTLAAAGVVEMTLLGQNVNSYGRDLTLQWRDQFGSPEALSACGIDWVSDVRGPRARPLFADLLRSVGSVDGVRRVRYTSPHPKDLRPETIEAMASIDAVMPHLHFPVQSGSDTILAEMRRGYTAASYLEKVVAARAGIDDLAVTSDIIVGFPGETEANFQETLELAAAAEYDNCYSFIFSPRPGTAAFELGDRFVAHDVVSERFARLKLVLDRSALRKSEARVGREEEVLVEGPSKRDPLMTSARTKQNKLIHFAYRDANGEQRALPAGTFCNVLVTGAAPYFLRGDLLEVTAKPRHRKRIPVSAVER